MAKPQSRSFWDQTWGFPLLFSLLVLAFYPELVMARSAPLVGDHWEQHYPWAALLSHSLKRGVLPFWTPLIQCGFPIAAESQIAVFYLPNLLLFGLLPLKIAYSWQLLVHFLISGLSMYAYARLLRLERAACFVAACIFVFGTSYGGAYYNVTSLKTICWLPFLLWQAESFLRTERKRHLFFLSLAAGMALVAGYMQVAALMLFMVGVYGLIRLGIYDAEAGLPRIAFRHAAAFIASALLALVIAAPQILLTFQLAVHSNRSGLEESYAYTGSMPPLALATLLLPHFQGLFRGNCLYGGMFAVFLLVLALVHPDSRRSTAVRLWSAMALVALFFSLGQWSPVYILFIKLTHFYSFRTPSKFLIFFNFSTSMLAASGFHYAMKAPEDPRHGAAFRKSVTLFCGVLLVFALALAAAYTALVFKRPAIEAAGEWLVQKTIFGKAGHPHSLEVYREKVASLIDFSLGLFSPSNPWNGRMGAFLALTVIFVWRMRSRPSAARLTVLVGILVLDLYVFSFADLRSDFNTYEAAERDSPAADLILEHHRMGIDGRLYGFRMPAEELEIVPGVNMLYGIEEIGAYSPLVLSRYFETVGLFGNVNDSNKAAAPSPDFAVERLPLLKSLGVTHVLSTEPLDHPDLKVLGIFKKNKVETRLYEMENPYASHAYFVTHAEIAGNWEALKQKYLAAGFDPTQVLLLEEGTPLPGEADAPATASLRKIESGDDFSRWEVTASGPGYFVVSETDYPGWSASVNGKEVPLLRAYGLFRAVYLEAAGTSTVEFRFSPWRGGKAAFQR
ncbi:MAG TPA: hypothetical protein VL688_01285 [Verrucomicrobiae bacterium]|jgi:hypothetical protein|nr:hypothetical protein [Verrucomicrobiae bacterium]